MASKSLLLFFLFIGIAFSQLAPPLFNSLRIIYPDSVSYSPVTGTNQFDLDSSSPAISAINDGDLETSVFTNIKARSGEKADHWIASWNEPVVLRKVYLVFPRSDDFPITRFAIEYLAPNKTTWIQQNDTTITVDSPTSFYDFTFDMNVTTTGFRVKILIMSSCSFYCNARHMLNEMVFYSNPTLPASCDCLNDQTEGSFCAAHTCQKPWCYVSKSCSAPSVKTTPTQSKYLTCSPTVPSNSNCNSASLIARPSTIYGTNNYGGSTTQEICGPNTNSDATGVWYKLMGSGQPVTLTTCMPGTNQQFGISVYLSNDIETCDCFQCLSNANYSTCSINSVPGSKVTFQTEAYQWYYFFVYSINKSSYGFWKTGIFQLNVTGEIMNWNIPPPMTSPTFTYGNLCHVGYYFNGTVCTDINECQKNPCQVNSHCINTVGSYTCECDDLYEKVDGLCVEKSSASLLEYFRSQEIIGEIQKQKELLDSGYFTQSARLDILTLNLTLQEYEEKNRLGTALKNAELIVLDFEIKKTESLTAINSPQKDGLPNIGYLGRGYDLLFGNPQSETGFDPGFKLPALSFEFSKGRTTSDGKFSLPDYVDGILEPSSSFDSSVSMISSEKEYHESLAVDVSVNGFLESSMASASFKANVEYKKNVDTLTKTDAVFVQTTGRSRVYSASVIEVNSEVISKELRNAITSLSIDCDKIRNSYTCSSESVRRYFDIIRRFGTHFTNKVLMGGKAYQQYSMTTSEITDMQNSFLGVSGSAEASGVAWGVKLGGGASFSTTLQNSARNYLKSTSKTKKEWFIGGEASLGSSEEGDLDSLKIWANTVNNNPVPIFYSLSPITDLFEEKYFPEIQDFYNVSSFMRQVLFDYCLENGGDRCSEFLERVEEKDSLKFGDFIEIRYQSFHLKANTSKITFEETKTNSSDIISMENDPLTTECDCNPTSEAIDLEIYPVLGSGTDKEKKITFWGENDVSKTISISNLKKSTISGLTGLGEFIKKIQLTTKGDFTLKERALQFIYRSVEYTVINNNEITVNPSHPFTFEFEENDQNVRFNEYQNPCSNSNQQFEDRYVDQEECKNLCFNNFGVYKAFTFYTNNPPLNDNSFCRLWKSDYECKPKKYKAMEAVYSSNLIRIVAPPKVDYMFNIISPFLWQNQEKSSILYGDTVLLAGKMGGFYYDTDSKMKQWSIFENNQKEYISFTLRSKTKKTGKPVLSGDEIMLEVNGKVKPKAFNKYLVSLLFKNGTDLVIKPLLHNEDLSDFFFTINATPIQETIVERVNMEILTRTPGLEIQGKLLNNYRLQLELTFDGPVFNENGEQINEKNLNIKLSSGNVLLNFDKINLKSQTQDSLTVEVLFNPPLNATSITISAIPNNLYTYSKKLITNAYSSNITLNQDAYQLEFTTNGSIATVNINFLFDVIKKPKFNIKYIDDFQISFFDRGVIYFCSNIEYLRYKVRKLNETNYNDEVLYDSIRLIELDDDVDIYAVKEINLKFNTETCKPDYGPVSQYYLKFMNNLIDYVDKKEGKAFFPTFSIETDTHIGSQLTVLTSHKIETGKLIYSQSDDTFYFYFKMQTNTNSLKVSPTTVYSVVVQKQDSYNMTISNIEFSSSNKKMIVFSYGSVNKDSGTFMFEGRVISGYYNMSEPIIAMAFARDETGLTSDIFKSNEISISLN